jgi:hypothetical protein
VIKRFVMWVIGLFIKKHSPPPVTAKQRRNDATVETSEFYHVKELLDALPSCRRVLRKLKKFDRDAFNFHKRMGARLIGEGVRNGGIRSVSIRESFLKTLPTAGMVIMFWEAYEKPEEPTNMFCYFQKIVKCPWNVEVVKGATTLYEFTVAFEAKDLVICGYTNTIALMEDGTAKVLKTRDALPVQLPNGRTIYQKKFDLGRGTYWHRKSVVDRSGLADPAALVVFLFTLVVNGYDKSTDDGFQITAKRFGKALSFSGGEKRAKIFFKDRDLEITTDGRRKRIFHTVEKHERQLKSGKTISVAAHYRGSRKFIWKEEEITIHPVEQSIRNFNVTSYEEDHPAMQQENVIAFPVAGKKFAKLKADQANQRGGYRRGQK